MDNLAGNDPKNEHLSSDCLNEIVKYSSIKHKIRLDLVCHRVRQHTQSLAAWSDIKSIVIKDGRDTYCRINDVCIPLHTLSLAIKSILNRCRSIRFIDLRLSNNPIVHSAVAESVVTKGATSFRKLTRLALDGQDSAEVPLSILSLINALKGQLRCLEFFGIHNSSAIEDIARLWELIGECVNLRKLNYFGMRHETSSVSDVQLKEMIMTALLKKPIRQLHLTTKCIKTEEMIQIISSLADDHSLVTLEFNSYLVTLPDLVQNLPLVHWTSIRHFRYSHAGILDNTSPAWSAILSLPILFPRLKSLMLLICWFQISVSQVIDLITTYLLHLNARSNREQRAISLKFTLFSLAMHARDRTEVFRSLVEDHKLELDTLSDDKHHYRIRCNRQGNGCIELYYLCRH